MSKFRKKPVVIEAIQWTGRNWEEVRQWILGVSSHRASCLQGVVSISTLEGVMTASHNDYIICGVQGELYPCKPDIFAATYEEVVE